MCGESPTPCRLTQGFETHFCVCERVERNESRRPGDVRHDEPMQIVDLRPSQLLGQPARVALVALIQRLQISVTVAFEDDGRRKSQPHEYEVEDEPPGATLAVEKRMDAFNLLWLSQDALVCHALRLLRLPHPHRSHLRRRPTSSAELGRQTMVEASCLHRMRGCRAHGSRQVPRGLLLPDAALLPRPGRARADVPHGPR